MVTITTRYVRVVMMSSMLLMVGWTLITTSQATLAQGIKTYTSEHFTIRYPSNWEISNIVCNCPDIRIMTSLFLIEIFLFE